MHYFIQSSSLYELESLVYFEPIFGILFRQPEGRILSSGPTHESNAEKRTINATGLLCNYTLLVVPLQLLLVFDVVIIHEHKNCALNC